MVICAIIVAVALLFLLSDKWSSALLDNSDVTVTRKSIVEANKVKPTIDRNSIEELSPQDILRHRLSDKKANYIGYVSIPSIGLKQPIVNELSNYAVSVGAAVYYDDMIMGEGNYVLASHFWYDSETALFSPLYYNVNQGAIGQEIYLTDLEYLYTYETIHYKVVQTYDTDYIQQEIGEGLITLFTCNYDSESGRVVMQGKLTKKEKLSEVNSELIEKII